jgi:Mrr N-terminal domain/HNH endonuclease
VPELPNSKDLAQALGQLIFANGGSMLPKDTIRPLADSFELSEELRTSLKPGDGQLRWDNRVHWARLVLANDGLLKKHIRGRWELTDYGIEHFGTEQSGKFAAVSNSVIDDIDQNDFGNDDPEYRIRMAGIYVRDPKVREQVLKRANGFCEECNELGFRTKAGQPYLETHHVISMSEQGPDRPHNVIALCATDHRRAHFAENWQELQEKFLANLSKYKTEN